MPIISFVALLGLIVGLILERQKLLKSSVTRNLSVVLVQGIYPCLIFSTLLLRFDREQLFDLWMLPVSVFLILSAGLMFGLSTRRLSRLEQEPTRRSYVFLTIMPNYSFVPLVIAQALFADIGVAYVAVASLGADLFLWTLAFPQIAGRFQWRKMASPALLSVVAAFVVQFLWPERGESWGGFLYVLNVIGILTLPLSMFVLGVQLAKGSVRIPKHERKAHSLIFMWRLLLCPLFLFFVLWPTDIPLTAKYVLMLSGSMPGAIITVVLSELHGADSRFAATSILWGHVLGILTVPLWQLAARFLT